jgi:hypothetical protein
MKTGMDMHMTTPAGLTPEQSKKIEALLMVFMENAITIGVTYSQAAGRNNLSSIDILYSLQYQAHHFENMENLEEHCENYIQQKQREEDDDDDAKSYDDDGSDNGSDSDSDSDSDFDYDDARSDVDVDEDADEFFTRATNSSNGLIEKMNYYHDTWDNWHPEDQIQGFLKDAINKQYYNT